MFSDDGSGFKRKPEDEALDAARGEVVAGLARELRRERQRDGRGAGRRGLLPLFSGPPEHRVGVLELYLPYAPIQNDIGAGLHKLRLDLIGGLAALYVALFTISASVSRGLRRQVSLNAFLAEHDALTELPQSFAVPAENLRSIGIGEGPVVRSRSSIVDRFREINDSLGPRQR